MEENKDLLLIDLCARLPYEVICVDSRHGISRITEIDVVAKTVYCDDFDEYVELDRIKPFLRPMSSMTKEELYEVQEILGKGVEIHDAFIYIVDSSINTFSYLELQAVFEWLNAHHFDHRGLIEKGLALEAPKGMYNLKKK